MPQHARSRTPFNRADDTERISRAICSFGRYGQHKGQRPRGLAVGADGSLSLHNLMAVWGKPQGLTSAQVLGAVQAHMLHEDDGALRFSITSDSSDAVGDIKIRVLPSRRSARQRAATPAATPKRQPRAKRDALTPPKPSRHPPGPAPPWRAAPEPRRQPKARPGPKAPSHSPPRWLLRPLDTPLDMPLDDIVKLRGARPDTEASGDRRTARAQPSGLPRKRCSQYPRAEEVQRWLSWLLKFGAKQLGVTIDNGWAQLDALAVALRARPDLGDFNGASLRCMLEETDLAGRFELDGRGRVRKVEKELRQPRRAAAPAGGNEPRGPEQRRGRAGGALPGAGASEAARAKAESGRSAPVQRRSPARSSSGSSSRSSRRRGRLPVSRSTSRSQDSTDRRLAAECTKSLQVSTVAKMEEDGSPAPQVSPAPPLPPGDHWMQYQDDGRVWWYYEGPRGKWWYDAKHLKEPLPYVE